MTTYTTVFGSDTIPPSDYDYVSLSLTANTTLYWPEFATGASLVAALNEVASTGAYDLTLPAANLVSAGRDFVLRNTSAYTITVKGSAGATIQSMASGTGYYFYIKDNSTAAGTWGVSPFGAATSIADANALAGSGLQVSGLTLNLDHPVEAKSGSYSVVSGDRAKTIVNTGGAVTYSLLAAATAGDGFFLLVSNQGSGAITVDPNSTETVDGASTISLAPGDSAILVCTGAVWYTVAKGYSTNFVFTQLVKDVSGSSNVTLTAVEAANQLHQYIGTLTGNISVIVPTTVGVYYVQNAYAGAFTLTVKTSAGTGVALTSSDRAVLYCDGVNVVAAQTATVSTNISIVDGTVSNPAIYFALDTDSGVYRVGANSVGITAGGTNAATLTATSASFPAINSTAIGGSTPAAGTFTALVGTTVNGNTITTGTGVLTIAASKTLTANNTLTLAGTDATTMTFPTTSATIARTDAANTFTGTQTVGALVATTVNGNTITTGTGVLTIAASKTLTASNTLTLAGTDATTMTFPAASTTVAGLGTAETFTAPQRGTVTTDNDGSFSMNGTNNFLCTPSAGFTLTFTNITAGQSGNILLVNGAAYAIAAAATTKVGSSTLATISATGTYWLSYYSPDGTNVYVSATGALA